MDTEQCMTSSLLLMDKMERPSPTLIEISVNCELSCVVLPTVAVATVCTHHHVQHESLPSRRSDHECSIG